MSVLQIPINQFSNSTSLILVELPPSYQEISQISELDENNLSNTRNQIIEITST
jgi:hypothetical protein